MDRSFLSDKAVIAAAKDFVAIRIATYEDESEAKFVIDRLNGGEGSLRNFGYALVSPEFKEILKRSERGPNFVYADGAAMAADMKSISSKYPAKNPVNDKSLPLLNQMKDVRLAVNVASCDGLPCLLAVGNTQNDLERLKKKLSVVIFDEQVAGKFICGSTSDKKDLELIDDSNISNGYLVVKPDAFGLKGETITKIPEPNSAEQLKKLLLTAATNYTRTPKTHGLHVREGRQSGITWKTEVEVPDRQRVRR